MIWRRHSRKPEPLAWVPILSGPQRPGTLLTTLPTHGFCICSAAWLFSCFLIHQAPSKLRTHSQFVHLVCCHHKVTNHPRLRVPISEEPQVLGKPAVGHPSTTQMTKAKFRCQALPFNSSHDIYSSSIPSWADIHTPELHTHTDIHTCTHTHATCLKSSSGFHCHRPSDGRAKSSTPHLRSTFSDRP